MRAVSSEPLPLPRTRSAEDPLEVATYAYFHKPMAAFFHSFELRAYLTAGLEIQRPVLDLGCHDGAFAAMLARCVGFGGSFVGLDANPRALSRYVDHHPSALALAGDAARLPFRERSFRTIISNAALESVQTGLEKALLEIFRILEPGGRLWCTIPTDRFAGGYWIGRLLERAGFRSSARRYVHRMNRRMTNFNSLAGAEWVAALERAGLRVERGVGFFPMRLVTPWSLLAWTPLRAIGLVRLVGGEVVRQTFAAAQRRAFRRAYATTALDSPLEECGYVLLRACRPGP